MGGPIVSLVPGKSSASLLYLAIAQTGDLKSVGRMGGKALLYFEVVTTAALFIGLFVVNVVAGLVIAGMLLRWRHWIPLFLLAGFGAATLGAFLIAVNGSLFGIHTSWSWYAS